MQCRNKAALVHQLRLSPKNAQNQFVKAATCLPMFTGELLRFSYR
jgi:hypothetical protein